MIVSQVRKFLSTLSLRRATMMLSMGAILILFLSTLSLRRATMRQRLIELWKLNFYPRSPCGERLFDAMQVIIIVIFLSTLSLRRATHALPRPACGCTISIHALLAESDDGCVTIYTRHRAFLSTLSLRRATAGPGP